MSLGEELFQSQQRGDGGVGAVDPVRAVAVALRGAEVPCGGNLPVDRVLHDGDVVDERFALGQVDFLAGSLVEAEHRVRDVAGAVVDRFLVFVLLVDAGRCLVLDPVLGERRVPEGELILAETGETASARSSAEGASFESR